MSFSSLKVEVNAISGVTSGGEQPMIIHNHLHMDEREIASRVSETTAKIGNKREALQVEGK